MLGLMVNDIEHNEMKYLVKRELEELLLDLSDNRIDSIVKQTMNKRYHTLFQLFCRMASDQECLEYMPKRTQRQ